MKLILLIMLFLTSCSPEQASRIGYSLGQGIAGTINQNEYINSNGYRYYKTYNCRDYGYVDGNYRPLDVIDCIIINESHYVAFNIGANIIYIILL